MNYNDCLELIGTKRCKKIWHYTYLEKKENFFMFRWGAFPFMEIFYDDTIVINLHIVCPGLKTRLKRYLGQSQVYYQRGNNISINWRNNDGSSGDWIAMYRRYPYIIKNGRMASSEDLKKEDNQYYLLKIKELYGLSYIVNHIEPNNEIPF